MTAWRKLNFLLALSIAADGYKSMSQRMYECKVSQALSHVRC